MAMIKVDADKLRRDSKSLEGKMHELEQMNKKLAALLVRMQESWEGSASTAYVTTMQGYLAKAEKMESVLREFKSYVDHAAEKFEQTDRNAAARLRGSF